MKKILLIAALCMLTSLTFAAKPEWAGQGKPDKEQVEALAEEMQDSERRSDILNRGNPGMGMGMGMGNTDKERDEDDDDDEFEEEEVECELSKEECAAVRAERKAQRELEREQRRAERELEREQRMAERENEAGEKAAENRRGKPEGVGQGNQNGQQRGPNAAAQQQPETNKGLQEQAAVKAEAERNELGKGSETGQQKRQENSKKWWQFWK